MSKPKYTVCEADAELARLGRGVERELERLLLNDSRNLSVHLLYENETWGEEHER